ncbi:MAG: DUF768 domain-containing protein [Mesorhizobium sp.]|uniref:DUF768 domain-containing protein n=1 Tax=Mesorhizobium sp. TaxID=1871066 RepID=UPI001AD4FECE|nr:hypothetical protein [Mesorhizobium sp.]MBN9221329.1 DUF768 domain-containing protein [Mesorhizobium sp.]
MSERTIKFLHLWLERNELLDGRKVDDKEISDLAWRLFQEATAAGISDSEIMERWDELHRSLVEIITRRHNAPAGKQ